jgi:hypothetical protein
MSSQHPIFQKYPLQPQKLQTSVGLQPTPYHIYDGHAVLMGGTADFGRVQTLLQNEHVVPARTQSGRALMALWAVDEPSASLGAHTEFQVSFYVTHTPVAPVRDGIFAALNFMLNVPGARQLCYGLWNNTPEVVAYNREILGLTPRLSRSTFVVNDGRVKFEFSDAQTNNLLLRGDVQALARQPMNAASAMFKSFGFLAALRASAMKIVQTYVTNRINEVMPRNADALTVSASTSLVAQLYDPAQDKIELIEPTYGALDFRPEFVEHMRGFKMVYLNPV